jgi:hypothetical protein
VVEDVSRTYGDFGWSGLVDFLPDLDVEFDFHSGWDKTFTYTL